MRLKELILNIEETELYLLKDYISINLTKVKNHLANLNFDDLLDLQNIAKIISAQDIEDRIIPRGNRFLKKLPIDENYIKILIRELKNLDQILSSGEERLGEIFGDEETAKNFIREREKIREQTLLGKAI